MAQYILRPIATPRATRVELRERLGIIGDDTQGRWREIATNRRVVLQRWLDDHPRLAQVLEIWELPAGIAHYSSDTRVDAGNGSDT